MKSCIVLYFPGFFSRLRELKKIIKSTPSQFLRVFENNATVFMTTPMPANFTILQEQ